MWLYVKVVSVYVQSAKNTVLVSVCRGAGWQHRGGRRGLSLLSDERTKSRASRGQSGKEDTGCDTCDPFSDRNGSVTFTRGGPRLGAGNREPYTARWD